jgi:hypothetical protein
MPAYVFVAGVIGAAVSIPVQRGKNMWEGAKSARLAGRWSRNLEKENLSTRLIFIQLELF